jgi:hypothetical protein
MRALLGLLLLTAACGGSSSGDDDSGGDPSMRYLPWQPGAVWSYKLTDPSGVLPPAMDKKTTVMAEMDVGGVHAGKRAFLVHVEQMIGSKDVYETFDRALDIRYQSIFYDVNGMMLSTDIDQPYRLKLDESAAHTAPNATWSTTFTETTIRPGVAPQTSTKTESWRVIDDDEPITVIAGTFEALHIQRTSSGGKTQDYWYVRGTGKVKETGSGAQEEELMSFTPGE